jgi:glycosyltransferase involved in cell wall biosynthesis
MFPYLASRAQLHFVVENAIHFRHLTDLQRDTGSITKTPTGSSPIHLLIQFLLILWAYYRFLPDYVIANNHKAAFLLGALSFLRLRQKKPTAVIIQDFDYYYLPFIIKNLNDALFLAPTPAVFSDLRYLEWGLKPETLRLIVFPCPTQIEDKHLVRSNADPFIACAARITRWKGIDYLVRAFALMKNRAPTAQLRIFGAPVDPVYHKELLNLVTELAMPDSVHFESFSSCMAQVYTDAEFIVVPSIGIKPGPESFCRIITEAWAHQKPSIAFAIGGPCFLIEDGVDGFLVEERNIEALADAMERLWNDPKLREDLGRNGYAKVKSKYDPEQAVDTLLGYLAEKA